MFGFVNKAGLKRPLVPLKEAKASIKLHLGTIWARSGPVRFNNDIKAQSSFAGSGTELDNKNKLRHICRVGTTYGISG